MKKCKINNCDKKCIAKGLCAMHYLRFHRYGRLTRKKLYHKIKRIKSIKYMHKKRFGGTREIILERDKYKCIMCGMSNKEHKLRWNRNLTLNHKDHKGRYSQEQNNNLDNLETLCLKCHGYKDYYSTH